MARSMIFTDIVGVAFLTINEASQFKEHIFKYLPGIRRIYYTMIQRITTVGGW